MQTQIIYLEPSSDEITFHFAFNVIMSISLLSNRALWQEPMKLLKLRIIYHQVLAVVFRTAGDHFQEIKTDVSLLARQNIWLNVLKLVIRRWAWSALDLSVLCFDFAWKIYSKASSILFNLLWQSLNKIQNIGILAIKTFVGAFMRLMLILIFWLVIRHLWCHNSFHLRI